MQLHAVVYYAATFSGVICSCMQFMQLCVVVCYAAACSGICTVQVHAVGAMQLHAAVYYTGTATMDYSSANAELVLTQCS